MSKKTILVLFVLITAVILSCQMFAQEPTVQVQAQPASGSTSIPGTAVPPTDTPLPPPTDTPIPTDTPLPTPTPGPVVVKDDFSSKSDIWGDCEHCTWKNGSLLFGPYPPAGQGEDQIFYVICEACGLHPYYRVSADVTFVDGYGDRTFGVLAGLSENEDFISAATVSTFKHALYESFDYRTKQWVEGTFKVFNAVNAGRGTNHIEVEIKPASSAGYADITVTVNGSNLISLYDQSVGPSWTGLYLGWHTVGASYDNFEYEEIPAN
jgi:hypothetical protein